jgi:hypothetical protein
MYTPVPAAGEHCTPMIAFRDVDNVLIQPANPITPKGRVNLVWAGKGRKGKERELVSRWLKKDCTVSA